MDESSCRRIVLYTAHTHQSNVCIRMDEKQVSFKKHILGIYQVYSRHIHWKSIYLEYTWYIPGKHFWGFQMIAYFFENRIKLHILHIVHIELHIMHIILHIILHILHTDFIYILCILCILTWILLAYFLHILIVPISVPPPPISAPISGHDIVTWWTDIGTPVKRWPDNGERDLHGRYRDRIRQQHW